MADKPSKSSESFTTPTNGGRRPDFTVEEVADALRRGHGVHTVAARSLGCSHETIGNYVRRHPELREVAREAKRPITDLAILKTIDLIKSGHFPAIKYWLETQAREDGFGRHVDIGFHLSDEQLAALSDEQLSRLARGEDPRLVLGFGAGDVN